MHVSDEEILRRVQQGERTAFVQIFDRYYQRVERYACRKLMNIESAADIASETFHRAFRSVDTFRIGQISYLAYLYIICRRLVATEISKRIAAPFLSLDDLEDHLLPEYSKADMALESVLDSERSCMLQFALNCLDTDDREVVHLAFEKDISRKDIAEIMGKPSVSAVTSHLHRAMTRLRGIVHKQGYFKLIPQQEGREHAHRG